MNSKHPIAINYIVKQSDIPDEHISFCDCNNFSQNCQMMITNLLVKKLNIRYKMLLEVFTTNESDRL